MDSARFFTLPDKTRKQTKILFLLALLFYMVCVYLNSQNPQEKLPQWLCGPCSLGRLSSYPWLPTATYTLTHSLTSVPCRSPILPISRGTVIALSLRWAKDDRHRTQAHRAAHLLREFQWNTRVLFFRGPQPLPRVLWECEELRTRRHKWSILSGPPAWEAGSNVWLLAFLRECCSATSSFCDSLISFQ